MKRVLISIMIIFVALGAKAQWDEEYRMEIGAGLGMVGYLGDYSSSLTKNLQPIGSVVYRRVFNPYMALKANVGYGKLKGVRTGEKSYYPNPETLIYDFNNTLVDGTVTFEYNFWPYGTGRDFKGAQRLTPFVFLGLGGTFVKASEKNVFTVNFPIGVGVKYKAAKRVNLGLEWAMHVSGSDKLDGVSDPYLIKSSGLFKNTDCYHVLQFTITYSFAEKCRTCHNERE
ncbi:MAG: porin family protein [Prevotella sp.]|nr:porin family protein [Prevotella sp.]